MKCPSVIRLMCCCLYTHFPPSPVNHACFLPDTHQNASGGRKFWLLAAVNHKTGSRKENMSAPTTRGFNGS